MYFEIVGTITHTETIGAGRGVRVRAGLNKKHGRGRWRKMKGQAQVRLKDGSIRLAELHWYEAHGIGRRDIKWKRWL